MRNRAPIIHIGPFRGTETSARHISRRRQIWFQKHRRVYERNARFFENAGYAADQLARRGDFAADLECRHAAMDEGKKWSHGDVLKLNEELGKQGI